jgi:glucan phosphoethanolaminetransferase (alkaline phosphatase superfamily)
MLLALALVVGKLYFLEDVSRTYFECSWCLSTKALPYEGQFLLLLVLLNLLAVNVPWRALSVTLRITSIGLLFITAIDLIVTSQFWVRLSEQYFLEFSTQFGSTKEFLIATFASTWQLLALLFATVLVLMTIARYLIQDQQKGIPLTVHAVACLAMFGCNLVESSEFHEEFLKNSIQAFFSPTTYKKPYSKEFRAAASTARSEVPMCYEGVDSRKDVILVIVESLSSYHSSLFSGLNDWTPELDAISKEGLRFSNFYANGVNTEQGLVSLLTGEPPVTSVEVQGSPPP